MNLDFSQYCKGNFDCVLVAFLSSLAKPPASSSWFLTSASTQAKRQKSFAETALSVVGL